jgi:hypothetical protein
MAQGRQEPRGLTTAEIRQLFVEMGLGSEREREKMLAPSSPAYEQGEKATIWIEATTGTATWQMTSEEGNAELE